MFPTQLATIEVSNQLTPPEGPRAIPLNMNFAALGAGGAGQSQLVDLSQIQNQTRMSMVQTIYIDLSGSDDTITVVVQGINQMVTAKGRTQGYYTLTANAPTKLQINSTGTDVVPMILYNSPIAGVVWATQ